MIVNISDCTSDETLTVYTNVDSKTLTYIAPFKFLPMELYFNTDSIAHIIVIKYVDSIPGVKIRMDSWKERATFVEYHHQIIKFW